jgi:hypothetical protein
MKAHRFAHLFLILFAAVTGGCQASRSDTRTSTSALPAPAAPAVSLPASGAVDRGGDPFLTRAVSAEEPESAATSDLGRSKPIAPGELPILPLNPVFDLVTGNTSERTTDEAYQTLAMFGLSGMTWIMRGSGHTGGRRGFQRAADFTDDLLQPEEEMQRSRRPPYAFGLEFKY